jgi:hypothetical protein
VHAALADQARLLIADALAEGDASPSELAALRPPRRVRGQQAGTAGTGAAYHDIASSRENSESAADLAKGACAAPSGQHERHHGKDLEAPTR